MSAGLTEEDFIGESVRDPLCRCLVGVAAALTALPPDVHSSMVAHPAELRAAADSLKVCWHTHTHTHRQKCVCL